MEERFPARPVRGVAVRCWTAGNCAPDFASFTLDFEPLPGPRTGYEFVADRDYGLDEYELELHEMLAPMIDQGVRLNLTGEPRPRYATFMADTTPRAFSIDRLDNAADGPAIALRVVLVSVRYHLVDSSEGIHQYAGWRAAHKARCLLAGVRPEADARDRAL
ncbi:hypothetical protein [Nonomuraea candida]|uniref:hypothetical protein n=1 Tax=Nonomuraea candida TaxID=359159 RepID=UPI0012F8E5E8|nr:hypothetical protein [Nonomuraea candida]